MTKRILSLILAAMLVFGLCACGGGKPAAKEAPDLAKFYETLFTGDDAPMMMPLEDDMLESFYPGLKDITRKQTVAYAAAISSIPTEIVLVEVEKAEDASKVEEILKNRIHQQVDENGAWYPETIEGWKNNSEVLTEGNVVALIVDETKDDIVKNLKEQFK